MSEHIVHTGIVEDSFALLRYLPAIPLDFAEAAEKKLDFARLGCITVAGDTYSFRLLEEMKPLWPKRDEILEAKLAFVLGWVSHRACDRQMKPIWNVSEMMSRGSDADPKLSPTECSVYHEAELYNRYYKDDPIFRLAIFDDAMKEFPCAELFDLDIAREYAESTLGVNMMNIQTILPPLSSPDWQRFMEDVCLRTQKFYVDVARYERAAGNPDPKLKKNYVDDINWFCAEDEIVEVAVKLRSGEKLTQEECVRAFEAEPASHYGQALKLSIKYFIAAAEYFYNPEMTMDTLKDRLDIGKLGRLGRGV